MMKLLLFLITISFVFGSAFAQDDAENLHFKSCDERLVFDYPAEFVLEEEAFNISITTPETSVDMMRSQIYLQHIAAGDEIDRFGMNTHISVTLDDMSTFFVDEPDVFEAMRTMREVNGTNTIQDIELYSYRGLIAYTPAQDGFLLQLDMGGGYILNISANAADMVPLTLLEETVDLMVQTLEFEPEYSVGSDYFFFFTNKCEFSLFYPNIWRASEFRGRYLFYDTPDTYHSFATYRTVRDEGVIIEIMPHERILSYFEIEEGEATLQAVLESYMTLGELLPLETPVLNDDDPDRIILTAEHASGVVSVMEINEQLTLIALYMGSDSEDYTEEYWALIDSIRLDGRAEEVEESVEIAD